MLTLYTGIGRLTLQKIENGKRIPIILMNRQEYALAPHELVLWSTLAFQILTMEEMKQYYFLELKRQNLSDKPDFAYLLRRLLVRGIVAEGSGVTAVDALYRLLCQMHITPVQNHMFMRVLTCLKLWMKGQLSLAMFPRYLKRPVNTKLETLILKLSEDLSFTVAELLGVMEHTIPTETALHQISETQKGEVLSEQVTLHHTQYPVLEGIANLYFKKQILLDK